MNRFVVQTGGRGVNLTNQIRDFGVVLQAIEQNQIRLAKAGQGLERAQLELAHLVGGIDARQLAFESLTFWQRLRWLIRGRAA